jgi:AraC-like DNA-binding protein
MLSRETPLRGHELFRTVNGTDLCREMHSQAGVKCVVPSPGTNFNAQVSRYEMPSGELWYAEIDMPVRLECPDAPYIRVQIRRAGGGVTSFAGQVVAVDASQSCISPSEAVIECSAGFQQLVWRVRYEDLIRKLVALTGAPISRKLTFEPVFKRSRPESKAFIAILDGILANIDHANALAPPFVLAELEDALMVSMLFNFQHSLRELLEQKVLDGGSWQVKRVEEYIEAHLDAPFDIDRIAAETGISARSIYRAFQRSRGYSPMAFARKRRLQRARRMLERGEQKQTVTAVAFVCGFNDVGHFSREFSKAFGESPSTVLGRSNRGAAPYR